MNRWQEVSNYKVNKYYDKFNKTAFHDFISANGFHKIKAGVPYNAKRFLESGIDRYKENSEYGSIGRYVMKGTMFRNHFENTNCFVLQPYTYYRPLDIIRSEIMSWAKKHGVQAVVYDSRYSWYYPGMTILIVISLPGVDIKVKKLVEKEERKERDLV